MDRDLKEFIAKELKMYNQIHGPNHIYVLDSGDKTTIGDLIERYREEFGDLY